MNIQNYHKIPQRNEAKLNGCKKRKLTPVVIISLFIFCTTYYILNGLYSAPVSYDDLSEITFSKLRSIRNEKKRKILDYFDEIKKSANGIKNDNLMISHFKKMLRTPDKIEKRAEHELERHFVFSYNSFYDLLFVDKSGFVFYSVRQESDFHTNILSGKLSETELAKKIRNGNSQRYVDYKYYPPSDEPASFFATPIKEKGKSIGWIILQHPLNKINTTLKNTIGRTGEVYIVNSEKVMLSESRFLGDSTILKLKIDTNAVKEALQKKSGERVINDYRGIKVFSSFEKFNVFGSNWIIIAEIDEDEVITEYYKNHSNYFNKEILQHLSNPPSSIHYNISSLQTKRVDMNEYAKAKRGSMVETSGISTCTAVAIVNPGNFGYLAHISPVDMIYKSGNILDFFSKFERSNFLWELINKVKHYDVYPYEFKKLNFFVVATHNESFENSIEEILSHNAELSSIRFLYNSKADSANMFVDANSNKVVVEWNSLNNTSYFTNGYNTHNLADIVKKVMNRDSS